MIMERQEQKCYNYLNESYINILKYFGNKGTYFKIIDNTLFDIRGKTY